MSYIYDDDDDDVDDDDGGGDGGGLTLAHFPQILPVVTTQAVTKMHARWEKTTKYEVVRTAVPVGKANRRCERAVVHHPASLATEITPGTYPWWYMHTRKTGKRNTKRGKKKKKKDGKKGKQKKKREKKRSEHALRAKKAESRGQGCCLLVRSVRPCGMSS